MRIRLLTIVIWGGICLVGCIPSSSTVPLVYNNIFSKDTIITLEKLPMYPAQFNPRCILFNNERILVRTSTLDNAVYSVFSYPKMKHLSYFGEQSEFIVPLEQFNDEFYLVHNDSLYFYKWVEGDSLKLFSTSFFNNIMGQQMLGVAKLNDNLYAYSDNCFDKGTFSIMTLRAFNDACIRYMCPFIFCAIPTWVISNPGRSVVIAIISPLFIQDKSIFSNIFIYSVKSCIHPIFHFRLNPSPSSSGFPVTFGHAVDSSAIIIVPGFLPSTTELRCLKNSIASRF